MDIDKMKRLEAHSWKVGTTEEFLGLTDEEIKAINAYLVSETERKEVYSKLAKEDIENNE